MLFPLSAASALAEAGPSSVTLTSGATAHMGATPETVTVVLSTGERFTAPNPYRSTVEVKLDLLESKAGDHLVAQVIAGDKIHVWVLMPQGGALKLGGEIADVQTVTLAGDLIMVGYVVPIQDGRTSVSSSIYRYSSASGTYEKAATPAAVGGGPSYPIPPTLPEADQNGHTAAPSRLGAVWSALLLTVLGLGATALAGVTWLLIRRRRLPDPAALGRAGRNGPVVSLSEQEQAELAALGLTSPVADLIRSLDSRSDLIPIPASPGGTMRFVWNDGWVLTRRWVVVQFHDGQRGGSLLLRYRPLGGTIDWTVLDVQSD